MKNYLFFLLFTFIHQLCWTQGSIHQAHIEITKESALSELKILGTNSGFGNSFLQNSDLNTAATKFVRLHTIEPSELYKFTTTLNTNPGTRVEFGLSNNSESSYYKIVIRNFSVNEYQILTPTYTSAWKPYDETTIFSLIKCVDKVDFYVENSLEHSSGFSSSESFEAYIKPISCNNLQTMVQLEFMEECETFDPFGRHSVLHMKVPVITSIVTDHTLKFSYMEKYNTGNAEPISIIIRNIAGNIVYNYNNQVPIGNRFGLNNHTIELDPSIFNTQDVYLMTVSGPNKNSTYYLKFKLQ